MKQISLSILLLLPCLCFSQKEIYIPNEWQQPNGLDYSLDRSAESDNFIVFWGPLAGDDPTQAPAEIAFDPQNILDTAEDLYAFYIDTLQFIADDTGLISQYKIILVMLHTWTGLEGWAFGGNYDGTVGAMWMHPHAASSGPTLAHEFTHTLQNYTWMMNPGHGFIDSSYVGFFWETHAEFMALQRYPSVALEFDMARWLNTCQFHWSSTRHHYQAFIFLEFLKEKDGIDMINRLWSESIIGEHPLEAYKRLKGINQEQLNDLFAEYAMRNVTWDYAIGDLLRERIETLDPKFVSHPTIIPETSWDTSVYVIQHHLAPQDYGYNIIRLYPSPAQDCNERVVHLELIGYPNFDAAGAGWRFGLVAVKNGHQPRYSPVYSGNREIIFPLEPDEDELYLVVTGAPAIHHNYQWEIGFPKIYRYPYLCKVEQAVPEGFQPDFRKVPDNIPGSPHPNGGGFVAATATVAPTAFIGPQAQVLDAARVLDQASVEGFSIVKDNALVEHNARVAGLSVVGENAHIYGNAVVTGQAHVFAGCEVYDETRVEDNALLFFTAVHDTARVRDNAFCWGANLHGDVIIGGDAEFFRECDRGTYLQFESAYNRNCDGLDDHPANADVNKKRPVGWSVYFGLDLRCDALYGEFYELLCEGDTLFFNEQVITESGMYQDTFTSSFGLDSIVSLEVDELPILHAFLSGQICPGDTVWYENIPFVANVEYDTILPIGCGVRLEGMLLEFEVDTSILVIENTLEVQQPSLEIQWYDCETNLPVDGAWGKTFTPSVPGFYKARMVTLDTCEAFSGCHYVGSVGIQPISGSELVQVYPNPVTDQLTIRNTSIVSNLNGLEILDITGDEWYAEKLNQSTSYPIDVRLIPPGVYMLRIQFDNGSIVLKPFVKMNR